MLSNECTMPGEKVTRQLFTFIPRGCGINNKYFFRKTALLTLEGRSAAHDLGEFGSDGSLAGTVVRNL